MRRAGGRGARASSAALRPIRFCWSEKAAARILLAAEEQTAGRGRHGRRWDSAAGADVTFSLSCPVRRPPRELASLSLVAAVAAVKALRALGVAAGR